MRLINMYEGKVTGLWRDSTGNDNIISFKKSWGSHAFSDMEVEALLEGKVITFNYTNGLISGHLQYKKLDEGKMYFGFCADFDQEYNETPIFDPDASSRYEKDRRNEAIMNEFMRLHYYSKLINIDGTNVQSEFISDETRQRQGIDVIYTRNYKEYVIDEKAQMDYMYREGGPLDTFVLELLNSSSGRVGWFINDELETKYYMFIWPHADNQLRSVDDIEYARYALVERTSLKRKIENRYQSVERLKEYASKLSAGILEGAYEKYNKMYFKEQPFDSNAYLVYTKEPTNGNGKVERPVNLVVSRKLIEEVAEETGILKRNDNGTNGGIN